MKHTVTVETDYKQTYFVDQSKKEAIIRAKKESGIDNNVFISGHNGQCTAYLNPNGNYEPIGKSW